MVSMLDLPPLIVLSNESTYRIPVYENREKVIPFSKRFTGSGWTNIKFALLFNIRVRLIHGRDTGIRIHAMYMYMYHTHKAQAQSTNARWLLLPLGRINTVIHTHTHTHTNSRVA